VFEYDNRAKTSGAIWLPVIWMILAGSRPLSLWLGMGGSVDENLEGNPLDRLVFSGMVVLGIGILLARAREVVPIITANAPLVLFVSYCALSVLWSDFPGIAFKRWVKALGDPIMVLIVLSDPNRSAAVKRFFAWTGYLFVPVSILFIKYYPQLGLHFYSADGTKGFIGVATDKNMLGAICFVSGLAAVWRIVYAVRGDPFSVKYASVVAHVVIIAMVAWLLHNANSMTSIACLAFGSILVIATSFPWFGKRRILVHGLVLIAVSAACIPLFLDAAGGVLSAVGRDPTLTQRTELWEEVIALTPNSVVGAGFESFWLGSRLDVLWTKFWWRPNESHNGYLELFLNLGWIGVALFAFVILTGYRDALATLRRDRCTGGLKLACLVAGIMYSLTEAGFRMMHPVWLSTMMAAVVVPVAAEEKATRATTISSTPSRNRERAIRIVNPSFRVPPRPVSQRAH
jgi:exopolysaccharide production protein ExoQ